MKFYPNTDLAGNSNFYLADIQYKQGNYAAAVKSYDQVLQSFPDGNKAAAAELKKGWRWSNWDNRKLELPPCAT